MEVTARPSSALKLFTAGTRSREHKEFIEDPERRSPREDVLCRSPREGFDSSCHELTMLLDHLPAER